MRGAALTALAAAVIVASIRWGSFVAGGSDSYCYVYQAQRWADFVALRGPLVVVDRLAIEAPWPNAGQTFVPVGHTPSPVVEGGIAPICPAGLSIAMVPFVLAGGPDAAFTVLPLFAAILVVATYAVGSRYGAPVGLASSALVAASPIFLYQIVQPMSDVAAAALWMMAVACATGTGRFHALWAGLSTSAAILTRPNLLPLGLAIGAFMLVRPERAMKQRLRAALTYAAAAAPGCLAVAWIQNYFFGSPLASGYGAFSSIFLASHVGPNLAHYFRWLWQSHTPVIVLAVLGPVVLPGALSTLFLVLFAVNLGEYLPYTVFEHWSFTRFLLPTLPLVLILVVAVVDATLRRWTPIRDSRLVLGAFTIVLALIFIREAEARDAFRLQRLESRFERVGRFVATRLPSNALVLTSWESGSVRYYSGRKTITWDSLDPAWLDRVLEYLRMRGYEPYLLFERLEENGFRSRFREASRLGALDWPPAFEVGGQVRIYRPADQQLYREGRAGPTEYAR